jgi:hypothetical protein
MTSKTQQRPPHSTFRLAALLFLLSAGCAYMKMNPPPDADKTFTANNNSCYLATAANILAGAGYGAGTTVQQRSDQIYGQLIANFGTLNGGWTDTAVSWWLGSANNVSPANPYTVVTVHGNKSPRYPWANANGAQFIGNELRSCKMLGLSISWPVAGPTIGSGGHAITAWGDEIGSETSSITTNPSTARLTDSDSDSGGDVQVYAYDAYTNPNPGGANEGNGWYIDYDPNHPYIKHIITLAAATSSAGNALSQKVLGSYRIQQTKKTPATDLHYAVKTDTTVLSYRTTIDRLGAGTPTITESQPRTGITVDWNLSANPAPESTWVTIDTEFVLPLWNAIRYENVYFTYPDGGRLEVPPISWKMDSSPVERAASIPNVTGGYVVGAFRMVDPRLTPDRQLVGEYRFVHQYSYTQSPEQHQFEVRGASGLAVTDLRFGHSYGMPTAQELWAFQGWMTDLRDRQIVLDAERAEGVRIDWSGKLPYPEGEDIKGRLRELKPVERK